MPGCGCPAVTLMAQRVDGKFARSARLTPANGITMLRLLSAPLMLLLIVELGANWVTAGAWCALASTDFLDGWVARRQGSTTSGAFLDPLADKVLVLGALVALGADGTIAWLPVVLIGGRELAISAYRALVARHGVSVPARPLAKLKTASQDVAVALLLLPGLAVHPSVGRGVLWFAVALALLSGAQYLLDSRQPVVAGG